MSAERKTHIRDLTHFLLTHSLNLKPTFCQLCAITHTILKGACVSPLSRFNQCTSDFSAIIRKYESSRGGRGLGDPGGLNCQTCRLSYNCRVSNVSHTLHYLYWPQHTLTHTYTSSLPCGEEQPIRQTPLFPVPKLC